jgi:hypothetical protein
MSLFGKVLLVVNLLAAAGFVYLATQDWKGRQTITAAGLRHQLIVTGLPLEEERYPNRTYDDPDEIPFVVRDGPGGVPSLTVSKKILETYFQAAPGGDTSAPGSLAGGPVANQIAEVKRVKGKIEEYLKAADGADKIALLKRWLLWQAETIQDRLTFQSLIDAGNADQLEKLLLARFDAVINPPKAADDEAKSRVSADEATAAKLTEKLAKVAESRLVPLDEGERRAKLAHLLVHLDTDAAWQKRVMLVVGLRRYVAAVATQAQRFQEMTTYVEKLIINDQGIDIEVPLPGGTTVKVLTGYFGQEAINAQQSRAATQLAAHQALLRTYWEKQKAEQDNRLAQRITQLTTLQDQLRKVKAEVDELLAQQAVIEAGLFEIQREVAITLDELYKLEAELLQRERERFGLPPKP